MSGMTQAFDKMGENASNQGKTLAEVLAAGFLKDMKDEGRKIAPTPEELTTTAKQLGWKLKRKPGWTPARELARRIRARGTFARGWKLWKTESEKFRVRIWLIDTAGSSAKVDTEKKVSDKAEKITGKKFQTKLGAMADRIMRTF
jgi:hypothetical protein